MVDVLGPVLHRGVEDYMDDVLIHSPTKEGLCKLLRSVLELLRARGLKLNKKKCLLGVDKVEFLGHTVSENGIAVSEDRKKSLLDIPTPSTVKQLRQLLGAWNYVREHISDFASIAAPLFALLVGKKTTKSQPLVWTPQAVAALSALRSKMNDAPLLHFVDPERPLLLETDASDVGIGAVLFQQSPDGKRDVIAYVSKAFRGPSVNWTVMEKEAFALYFAVNKLRHYLLGRHFVIRTDCKNLLFGTSNVPKIQRWTLRLQEFDYEIHHIKGSENVVADALSRLNLISAKNFEAIRQVHGGISGHHGAVRTAKLLRDSGISWDTMELDCKEFVSKCFICAKMKRSVSGVVVSQGSTMSEAPFKVVAMDLVGPFPVDSSGCTYVLVMTDVFSRFVWLKALHDKSALTVAKGILELVGLFGVVPAQVRSDHGSEFTAAVTRELLSLLGVSVELTVTDHPASNGIVERQNANIANQLRCLVAERNASSSWSLLLPLVQRIVNSTPNRTTGLTPLRVLLGMYGQDSPSLLASDSPMDAASPWADLVASQKWVLDKAQAHQQHYQEMTQKQQPLPTVFEEGELVLAQHRGNTPASKLSPRYRGPYVVLCRTGATRYDIKHLATEHVMDVHLENLRKFQSDSRESAEQAAVLDAQVDKEYLVEALIAHKFVRRPHNLKNLRFKVRWAGWGKKFDSWSTYANVQELEALDVYVTKHPYLASLVPNVGQDSAQAPTPVLREAVSGRTPLPGELPDLAPGSG
jgi:transposase InsO family protein